MPVYSQEKMCEDNLFLEALIKALSVLRVHPTFIMPKKNEADSAVLTDMGQLILGLLEPLVTKRLSVKAAMAHRWILG